MLEGIAEALVVVSVFYTTFRLTKLVIWMLRTYY